MNEILENLYATRELYSSLYTPICTKYKLTPAELLVLLFLANNRGRDTARDIVEKLKLAKSHVSVSVRDLAERGYLRGAYSGHDHRSIHLGLCDAAADIIADARAAQTQFLSVLSRGFSDDELNILKDYLQRITDNINAYGKATIEAERAQQEGVTV